MLASRREDAVHEMKEHQAGRVPIEDGATGVSVPTDDAITDEALNVGRPIVAALDFVDTSVDMESVTQHEYSSDDDNQTVHNSCLAGDDPFA